MPLPLIPIFLGLAPLVKLGLVAFAALMSGGVLMYLDALDWETVVLMVMVSVSVYYFTGAGSNYKRIGIFVTIVFACYFKGFVDGAQREARRFQEAIQIEENRQKAENKKALDEANSRARDEEERAEKAEAEIAELKRQASKDPGAKNKALPQSSVDRIGRVR